MASIIQAAKVRCPVPATAMLRHGPCVAARIRPLKAAPCRVPKRYSSSNTIVENIGGGAHLASPDQQFTLNDVPSQEGKVAVVTGGSEGIGYAVSHTLLSKGLEKLFIISINPVVIEDAKKAVAEEMGADIAEKVVWVRCDLNDWAAVTAAAKTITEQTDRLDILVLNAARGIMTYQLTDYGVDMHMAQNHMGHVILTSHLLPLLKETASKGNVVRIAQQASNAHRAVSSSEVKFESLEELNQDLGPNKQYGRSKVAAILYMKYLARHLTSTHPNIIANSSHPGLVKTRQSEEGIYEPYPILGFGVSVLMAPLKKDIFEGALSILYCATKAEKAGRYYCVPAIDEEPSELAKDDELGERLMKLTTDIVSEKTRSQSVDKGCPMQLY